LQLAKEMADQQDASVERRQRLKRLSLFLTLVLTLTMAAGCSRQPSGVAANSTTTDNAHQLPFDRVSEDKGITPTAGLLSGGIPAGTAIRVRLESPLSSADSHTGDGFQGVLDRPISVAGQTLVPRGSPVRGTVLAADPSGQNRPGVLRLTLSSISINGKNFSLKTSSVFAKGDNPARAGRSRDVKFSTAKRLTFQVAQPLPL
jgi:hypothetical protein